MFEKRTTEITFIMYLKYKYLNLTLELYVSTLFQIFHADEYI